MNGIINAGDLVMKCSYNNKFCLIVYQGRQEDRDTIIINVNNMFYLPHTLYAHSNYSWKLMVELNDIKIFFMKEKDYHEINGYKVKYSEVVKNYDVFQLFE